MKNKTASKLCTSICKHLNCSCQINLYIFCEFNVKKRFATRTSSSLPNSQIKHKSNIHVEGYRPVNKNVKFFSLTIFLCLSLLRSQAKILTTGIQILTLSENPRCTIYTRKGKIYFLFSFSIYAFTLLLCCHNCMEGNYRHVGHLVTIIRGQFRDFFPEK